MFYSQRYTRRLLRLILSPPRSRKVWVLEWTQSTVLCRVSHMTIVGNRLCDECKKSILLVFCHMPESIQWLIVQVCSLIQRILRQFVSKLLTILQLIRVPPAWHDGHPSKDLKLCCKAAPLSWAMRLSQALVHFVTARTSLFTDQRMSGPPIRAKYGHFKTTWEHTLDNSPTVSNSSFLKLWSSNEGVETLCNCSVLLFTSSQFLSTHFWRMSLCGTTQPSLREIFPTQVIFQLLQQKFVIRTCVWTVRPKNNSDLILWAQNNEFKSCKWLKKRPDSELS